MTQTALEDMKLRILEIEMYVSMMRDMPEDRLWVEAFIPLMEERVGRLKAAYAALVEAVD